MDTLNTNSFKCIYAKKGQEYIIYLGGLGALRWGGGDLAWLPAIEICDYY